MRNDQRRDGHPELVRQKETRKDQRRDGQAVDVKRNLRELQIQ
jgi:hypothetical protein